MDHTLVDSALRQAAACARERYAGEEKRIERGLLVALNGQVTLGPEDARVQSDRDPEVFYTVSQDHCDCPDWHSAPDGRCKHRLAVYFTRIARLALQGQTPNA